MYISLEPQMQLHSDHGTNFQSNAFKEMSDFLSIDKTRTTSYTVIDLSVMEM